MLCVLGDFDALPTARIPPIQPTNPPLHNVAISSVRPTRPQTNRSGASSPVFNHRPHVCNTKSWAGYWIFFYTFIRGSGAIVVGVTMMFLSGRTSPLSLKHRATPEFFRLSVYPAHPQPNTLQCGQREDWIV